MNSVHKDMPDILFEDNHLLAINKRAGDLSQPDSSGEPPLQSIIADFLKIRDSKPGNVYIGTLHRLDRPVSGVLLFAKTSKAAGRVADLIRLRKFQKFYLAITPLSSFPDNEWIHLTDDLIRDEDITRIASTNENGTHASLHVRTLSHGRHYSLSLIRLDTGRKHQIRAQFSSRNIPILGDGKYGSEVKIEEGIALHACFLSFEHPVKKEPVIISAPIPEYLKEIITNDGMTFPDTETISRECLSFIKNIGH